MIELDRVTKVYKSKLHTKIVVDDVTIALDPGKAYGILGQNGAGKSTLLRMIAGTEMPTRGRIRRGVRVSWPLGFSGGFHPDMTGRENVVFVARIYGADVRQVIDFVADFAELGVYLDVAVKTYSSGMMARLAFGLSMAIDFDCYLIDEVTAVGDSRFQLRCAEAFAARRSKSGIIMVSHSIGTIKEYCGDGVVLKDGKLLTFDQLDDAIEYYKVNL